MIYATTGIKSLPQCCKECPIRDAPFQPISCKADGLTRKQFFEKRPDWCPLTEIDETLPVQLECAEMRLRKDDRLKNGG